MAFRFNINATKYFTCLLVAGLASAIWFWTQILSPRPCYGPTPRDGSSFTCWTLLVISYDLMAISMAFPSCGEFLFDLPKKLLFAIICVFCFSYLTNVYGIIDRYLFKALYETSQDDISLAGAILFTIVGFAVLNIFAFVAVSPHKEWLLVGNRRSEWPKMQAVQDSEKEVDEKAGLHDARKDAGSEKAGAAQKGNGRFSRSCSLDTIVSCASCSGTRLTDRLQYEDEKALLQAEESPC